MKETIKIIFFSVLLLFAPQLILWANLLFLGCIVNVLFGNVFYICFTVFTMSIGLLLAYFYLDSKFTHKNK